MQKKVAVIGFGYVGKAVAEMFKDHYGVHVYDPYYSGKYPSGVNRANKKMVNRCDLAFICVPTPIGADGMTCDTAAVRETLEWIETPLVVLKSTCTPGTTEQLSIAYPSRRIVFSPEYIGEGRYWQPYPFNTKMVETPWFIFGGSVKDCEAAMDFYVPITGPKKRYFIMGATEAELTKYFENTYFAVKVTFANTMRDICARAGVSYYRVREAWAADPRVDPMHTMVFPEKRGYTGKCLPKDTKALIAYARSMAVATPMLDGMDEQNETYRHGDYSA